LIFGNLKYLVVIKMAAKKIREIKPNDVIYTPKALAKYCIDLTGIKDSDSVLDPCRGGGVFYDQLTNDKKYYCEISENKDFFDFNEHVDVIIGNPPYSMWDDWLNHTVKICDKFCYVFGVYNFTPPRLQRIKDSGFEITKFTVCKVDWWFSPTFVVVFERGATGIVDVIRDRFLCDICNGRCKRGRGGVGMNSCTGKQV